MVLMQLFIQEIGASRGSKWRMIIILTFAADFFISHHLKVGPLLDLFDDLLPSLEGHHCSNQAYKHC